jgi:hypothetical protein
MASSSIALAAAAAKISTVAQMRAAMGAVTSLLSQGYDALSITGPSTSIPNLVEGTRDAAFSLLNTVNASAQTMYAKYPDAPLDPGAYGPPTDLQTLSTWDAHLCGVILSEANDAVSTVEKAIGTNLGDLAALVTAAIQATGQIAGQTIQYITNQIAAGASAFVWAAWPTLLLVGGLGVAYLYRDRIAKSLGASL